MKKTVLIVCGGVSEEHEISLLSAKNVLHALDRSRFDPLVVGIAKNGHWYFESPDHFYTGELRADRIQLNLKAPTALLQPFPSDSGKGVLWVEGKCIEFDIAFPLVHGRFGEDGTLQGTFEMMGVAYVGSDLGASFLCMDKIRSKLLCRAHGVAVADFVSLNAPSELLSQKAQIEALGFPCFVKPSQTGSSIGITKVLDAAGLPSAVTDAFRFDSKILIEKAIAAREIECAVLGSAQAPRVARLGEVIPHPKVGWYSYDAKYLTADGAELKIPALLDANLEAEAKALAVRVFQILGCHGLARVDLFLEKGTQRWLLNEVNTLPGFTPISMYPKMWLESGLSYSQLISTLIELALTRHR